MDFESTIGDIESLLADLQRVHAGAIGDLYLSVFWETCQTLPEPSPEAGTLTLPVSGVRNAPGGAANVARILAALGCSCVRAFGVVGADAYGRELRQCLRQAGIDGTGVQDGPPTWVTQACVTLCQDGDESLRCSLGIANALDNTTADRLILALEAADDLDSVVITQRVAAGVHSDRFARSLNHYIGGRPGALFVADVWDSVLFYLGAVQRRSCDVLMDAYRIVEALARLTELPAFVTCADAGCFISEANGLSVVPSIEVAGPVDRTGASDAFTAAVAVALATGRPAQMAAEFATLAAATVNGSMGKGDPNGAALPEAILETASRVLPSAAL